MKILPLFLLLSLLSCQNNPQCESESDLAECKISNISEKDEPIPAAPTEVTSSPATTPAPDAPTAPEQPGEVVDVPDEAFRFDARVAMTNFRPQDEDKVRRAIEIIREVIKTPVFKESVINFEFDGNKKFIDTTLTNEEVYNTLLKASEELLPETDHEMDLELELYYSRRNVVGYTYPNVLKIWMNRKFFNVYTPAQVAGNIFHEWTHKLGFEHDYRYSRSRDASVPYAIGYLIRDLGKNFE